ncbi:uncharacterized protein PV06_11705 [Exophiala oligosperma]|uniref:Uncharacterized protein n=1 Tax=Exophiala oligosperma TaxID=215243 RepID=A0A0D2D1A6_9EURO|nr:uncharacterized protein PV06_11705 [Exophiala oligosperma]KIW35985.1 hypothetical protein PV06_11705 [Exophiala oligosperma]
MADEAAWAWRDNRSQISAKLVEDDWDWGVFEASRPHLLPLKVFLSWHFTSDGLSDGMLEPIDDYA